MQEPLQEQTPERATKCPAVYKKRTIHMPTSRANQIALAAASINVTSELLIQSFITAGLLSMADDDTMLALALAKSGGASWEQIAELAKAQSVRERK